MVISAVYYSFRCRSIPSCITESTLVHAVNIKKTFKHDVSLPYVFDFDMIVCFSILAYSVDDSDNNTTNHNNRSFILPCLCCGAFFLRKAIHYINT